MSQSKHSQRQRAGIWSNGSDTAEDKRARNRHSQRSFRERRALRIQELEARVEYLSMGEAERNATMVSTNAALKDALIRARQQFLQMEMMMASLNTTLTTALSLPTNPSNAPDSDPDVETSARRNSEKTPPLTTSHTSRESIDHHTGSPLDSGPSGLTGPNATGVGAPPLPLNQDDLFNICNFMDYDLAMPALPEIESQSGSPPSKDASQPVAFDAAEIPAPTPLDYLCTAATMPWQQTDARQPLLEPAFWPNGHSLSPNGFQAMSTDLGLSQNSQYLTGRRSPSLRQWLPPPQSCESISGCVEAMEKSLISYMEAFVPHANEAFVSKACLILMVYFARHIWPGPTMMWFGSHLYGLAERCLHWRVSRSANSLKRLPRYLAPTPLQSRTPHHAIISWVTMAPLRDRIIQECSSGKQFDEMWLDLMWHGVVEVEDISTILTGVGSGPGFLGTWSIFDAMSDPKDSDPAQVHGAEGEEVFPELSQLDTMGLLRVYRMPFPSSPNSDPEVSTAQPNGTWEPVSSERLFSDSDLARKLYYHLELYNAHKNWRTDPAFYEKYPNLKWEGHEKYNAKGRNFSPRPRSFSIPSHQSLDKILVQYQLALITMNPSKLI